MSYELIETSQSLKGRNWLSISVWPAGNPWQISYEEDNDSSYPSHPIIIFFRKTRVLKSGDG